MTKCHNPQRELRCAHSCYGDEKSFTLLPIQNEAPAFTDDASGTFIRAVAICALLLWSTFCVHGQERVASSGPAKDAVSGDVAQPFAAGDLPSILSSIHGFAELSVKNSYITPRGLVVHTNGLAIQSLMGLVADTYSGTGLVRKVSFVSGVWADLHTGRHGAKRAIWNEIDYFTGISTQLGDRWDAGVTYVLFTSPPHDFKPEHNIEFKLAYKDNIAHRNFSLDPYVKLFYAVAGDSTVVLGSKGHTFDVETGFAPSYAIHAIEGLPITIEIPTFVTIGGPGFFGDSGRLGTFSTGPWGSIPVKWISLGRVKSHLDIGLSYYRLLDNNLVRASILLGNGGRRDEFIGQLRIGMSF